MFWRILAVIVIAGAIGGLCNAIYTGNKSVWPTPQYGITYPGALENVLLGGFSAALSWGLYSPAAAVPILGAHSAQNNLQLTVGGLFGAALVGFSGSRWLTNEVDKSALRKAAISAAQSPVRFDTARIDELRAAPNSSKFLQIAGNF